MLNFATVQVGQHFGAHAWQATPELAQRWRQAFGEPAGPRLPAGFAFVYTSEAVLSLMPPKAEGGIHAKQAFTFGAPVEVGDMLRTELFVHDKYEKRGRLYVELCTRTVNQHGALVLEGLRTTIWAE
jgi:hypothetical protein